MKRDGLFGFAISHCNLFGIEVLRNAILHDREVILARKIQGLFR